MLSKAFLLGILLVATATNYVTAFTLRIGDGGTQAHRKDIQDAAVTANKRLDKMLAVLDGPKPRQHNAIITAFGPQADIREIRFRVGQMISGRLTVESAEVDDRLTQGGTNERTKVVSFGHVFFSSGTTKKERAGTIIHEASHSLAGTVDYFDQDGNPYAKKANVPGKLIVGYKDSNLDDLIRVSSHNTFHNADSYRVFSDLV